MEHELNKLGKVTRQVQILEIMGLLTEVWLKVPELRFGQLVNSIWRNDIEADIFFYRSDPNVFGRLDKILNGRNIYESIVDHGSKGLEPGEIYPID